MPKLTDVIIIGAGPAGVTGAMYTARSGLSTTIIYKDHGALKQDPMVDNFYGHLEITGKKLINIGIEQARNVGTVVTKDEVLGIVQNPDNTITVTTAKKERLARAVMIATGASRTTPPIKGLAQLEGRGVSYCAICDGFFHKGKNVAVIGSGAYALHEAQDLLPIAKTVTVLTDGKKPTVTFPKNVIVKTAKIQEVCGQSGIMGATLKSVVLSSGEEVLLSGLFVALGVAGGVELARKLGATIEGSAVVVDNDMETSVQNIWAAGDCVGGLKQIAKATCDGAIAGLSIIKRLKAQAE